MKELWIMAVFATVSLPQGDLTTSSAIPTTIDITTPTTTAPITHDPPTTSAPITHDPPTTSAPVTPDPPTTNAPLTPDPPTTTAPLTSDPPTTTSPLTPDPSTTTAPLTPDPPTTTSPLTPDPPASAPPTNDTPTTDLPTTGTPTTETTDTPTTDTPTTDLPTTDLPTTELPTTKTTDLPTTVNPTTGNPTTDTPTTETTDTPTTDLPTTETTDTPTTGTPTTGTPTTGTPTTGNPTTDTPTTETTDNPTTGTPTTGTPTTDLPTTETTDTPTTDMPTTELPNTETTDTPTTDLPTTDLPTTGTPTTDLPTTELPTTETTDLPTTGNPTTGNPNTDTPTTETTDTPTTDLPTTETTDTPTTGNPTTGNPTTGTPTTGTPTTVNPTTDTPTTEITDNPTTGTPTTGTPTTDLPTTETTDTPTTDMPTTELPNTETTDTPTTGNPTTGNPTTGTPTTGTPTTGNPNTDTPTTETTDTPTPDLPTPDLPTPDLPTTGTPTTETPTAETPTADTTTDTTIEYTEATTGPPATSYLNTTGLPTTGYPTSIPITSISLPSTTTIPPLVCINGGELQSGVCICPDEWTGETCSKGNFCNSTSKDGFSFPRTTVGWSAYSEELCDEKTTSAGLPRASARCLNDTGSPMFGPPHKLQCEFTLSDILGNISSSSGDLLELAFSTQILTSQPEQLSADKITTAAQIANALLQSENITEDIAVAAVTTISQLLNASEESTQERDAVQNLTETLEKFSLDQHSNVSLVVQPNLAVQSVQVPSDTVGIQFIALTGRSGNFVANRINLNTNTSELIADKGGATDVQIVIKFTPVLRSKNTNHSIGFVLYQNDRFFRSRAFRTSSGTSRRVISANLGHVSGLHVEMLFKPAAVPNASLYDFACVSWNYTLKDWTTYGCSKVNHSEDGLQCFCNHTTNFAVLMSFRRDFKYAEALNCITLFGCSMSIIGLSLTITFQIATRKSPEAKPTVLLVSVCMCLLIFTLLFMLGVDNPHKQLDKPEIQEDNILPLSDIHTERDRGPCTAVTTLLQYFLLGTFTWNALYATHNLCGVLMNRNSQATSQATSLATNDFPNRDSKSSIPLHFTAYTVAIGWGLPAVLVALTLGISYRVDDPLGYRQEEFCWLAALDPKGNFDFKLPMFWGFLIPVAFMLIFNTVVLVLIVVTTAKTNPHETSTRQTSMMKKFLSSFSLPVVLSLSWILGYLLLITQNQTMYTILNISFCVLTTTQGLQIFFTFAASSEIVKRKMSDALKSVSSAGIPLHTKRFSLWRDKRSDDKELYTQLDTILSTH
uniref:Adhesion G protein-coupled receptor G7 n=1 Tax=Hucho hucho TaxID=62062 RepID=A0A4W5LGU5_9TELE